MIDRLQRPANIARLAVTVPVLLALGKSTEQLIKLTRDGRTAVFPNRTFGWEAMLEDHADEIRAELEQVLVHDDRIPRFKQVHEALTVVDAWKAYMFCGYGTWFERNCRECPTTAGLLRQVPDLTTAMFSILPPGTHIPPHRGIYKGVLRYHLGLRVPGPEGACRFRVLDDTVTWQVGKGFVFDNIYEHEAWNDSDDVRVVLFLDFVRPLPGPVDRLNRLVIAMLQRQDFVREAEHNLARFYASLED